VPHNNTNRKSSQAFIIKLFGGLIGWRANKQDTITTLITKAELLALAQAAKESMYVNKLLQKLIIDLNDQTIQIECDNIQTINLIIKKIALLRTKLRHINIYNY
jgi:Zn-dependent M16 (insulinase) family peptidase